MQKMKDISGQRFGRLVALSRQGVDAKGNVMWLCKCDCGGTSVVRGGHLRSGQIQTCGGKGKSCKLVERADLTGQQFNSLKVLRRAGVRIYSGNKVQMWECLCACGKKCIVSRIQLRAGQLSCGCVGRAQRMAANMRHGMYGTPEYRLLHGAKRRARQRGYESNLELSDIAIPALCPLLGIPLKKSLRAISANSPTVDKLDPNGRYMKGNIWIISHQANKLKSNMTLSQMKSFAIVIEQTIQTYATTSA